MGLGKRRTVALGVMGLCLASAGRADQSPTESEIAQAIRDLAEDDIVAAAGAIKVLARAGTDDAVTKLMDFGAGTRHLALCHEVGGSFVAASPDKAAAQLRRLRSSLAKQPAQLARVAAMASHLPGPDGLAVLSEMAGDPRDRVAVAGIRGLRGRPPDATRPLLLRLLSSKREDVAVAAALALGELPADTATSDALFKAVQKGDLVGGAAALSLTKIEGTEGYGDRAFRMLGQRAEHDSFHALAKLALWRSKDPGKEDFEKTLRSPADEVREVACDLIGLRRLPGYERRLLSIATGDKSWRTRVAAWLALRRSGVGEVSAQVRTLIESEGEPSYWAIQCAASRPNGDFVEVLRKAALDTKDEMRRMLAQIAIARHTEEAQATREFYLAAWKRSRGTPEGEAALIGVGHLRDADSFRALVSLLEVEKKKEHAHAILKGLEKLTGHYYAPDAAVWKEWFAAVGEKITHESERFDRRENRAQAAKTEGVGLSPEFEAGVDRGLSWLVRHQDVSGAWRGREFDDNCASKGACTARGGVKDREPAYTALALLALQGAGHRHLDGPYGDAARAGFAYVFAKTNYDGSHYEKEWTFCYESSIACNALCDGYALTKDPWLAVGGQRMVDYLAKVQHPGQTWRYSPRAKDRDTSVLSWVVMACVSAQHAGLDVPEQMLVGAEVWLNQVCEPVPPDTYEVLVIDEFKRPDRYAFDVSRDERGTERSYKLKTLYKPGYYTASMPAVGVLCRIWLGWTRAHPFCVGNANQLLSHIPGYNERLSVTFPSYPYTWYYGSLAMYQMGGRYWTRWREECLKDLLKHQRTTGCTDGAWVTPSNETGEWSDGGSVYCTSMAVLALESFYRYLPYLARSSALPTQK